MRNDRGTTLFPFAVGCRRHPGVAFVNNDYGYSIVSLCQCVWESASAADPELRGGPSQSTAFADSRYQEEQRLHDHSSMEYIR